MRSVLVILAAIVVTVVSGGPAAAEFTRKQPNIDKALMQRIAAGMAAERKATKVYVVQMATSPAISYAGGVAGYARTAPESGVKYDARSGQSQLYVEHLAAQQDSVLRSVGATDRKIYSYRHAFNGFAARLSGAQVAKLRKNKAVKSVWEDRRMPLDTNNTPTFLRLLNEDNGLRAKHGLRGKGVIVGIIDTGAVQEHPSFDDEGFQPPQNWNGICQAGEGWDADDCNNKLIGARWFADGFLAGAVIEPNDFLSPRDSDGHGTHTATTAAGREVRATLAGTPVADISGMAPDAYVAIYKACFEDLGGDQGASCFFSDSAAATEAAVMDGVDVLSFSVSTDPAFNDPQDIAFLNAVADGVFVARASGNDGPAPSSTPAGEPWAMTVGASTHSGKAFANATVINSPASVAGRFASLEGAITRSLQETGPVTNDLVAAEPIDACGPIAPIGGKIALIERGTCFFDDKLTNAVAAGASAVLVYTNLLEDGSENPKTIMGGDLTFPIPGVMIDNAPGVAILAAITGGATVNVTLSAGSFISERMTGNIMADISSRGPYLTEPNWIKPDITAPGVRILAGATPEPNDGSFGDLFQYLQGTSMSTPHVSGIAALLIERHPDWTPAQIKSALMTTARQNIVKEDGITHADPFDFGAGHMVPNRAINPGLTYDAGLFDYLAATCGTVSPLVSDEDCATLESLGFSRDPADLNLPSIAVSDMVGSKTIRRTVTNVGGRSTYEVSVQPPPGIKVQVNPESFTIAKGESKTFEVTFTNWGAPSGEWRFGRLTWSNGNQDVRSPIAISAQTLVAPDAIAGAGPEGSTSFDVTFGYNGAYTAGVHGLVDPFIQVGTGLPDDPDNTFDFGTGTGDILAYALPIPAGTAYAQWSTYNQYADGEHDFDLYLFYCPADPSLPCPFVDASFSFTSDEQVSVDFPLSDPSGQDAYMLFLHAFETEGGAPAGLAVFDWTDPGPGADEGNMTVTGPASAVSGQTETLNVSWEGLTTGPGAKQVGAISHSDENGPDRPDERQYRE